MNISLSLNSRRSFLRAGTIAAAGLAGLSLARAQDTKETNSRPKRPKALDAALVNQIVEKAHFNFQEVDRLLKQEPRLVNATWDWGGGDFETALGAASHMGRNDIAQLLLDAGARKDLFYYAMEGNLAVLMPAIDVDPSIVQVPGPHTLSLLYHAAISGNIELTVFLKEHGGMVEDHLLNASVQYGKSYEMTEWLLDNGASYHGQSGFGKKPLAKFARDKGMPEIANLLDARFVGAR